MPEEQLLKFVAERAGEMLASKLTKVEQNQALDYARLLAI
jgi:hypothetical protein